MTQWYGFNYPFIGGAEGVLSRQEDDRLIRNDVLQILFTTLGSRVMRPTFGTPLRNFVFENMTPATLSELESAIENSLASFEHRAALVNLDLSPSPDRSYLSVHIVMRLITDPDNVIDIDAQVPVGG
jgi:hypothetical protein